MRLAYIVASLGAPPSNGLQEQTLLTIREFVRAGVDVDVFAIARVGESVDVVYLEQACGVSLREPVYRTRVPGVVNALLRHLPQRLVPRGLRRMRITIEGGRYESYHFDGLGATVLLSRSMRPAVIGLIDPGSVRFRRFMRSAHGLRARFRAALLCALHELAEAGLSDPNLVWHLVSTVDASAVRSRRPHQAILVVPIMRAIAADRPSSDDLPHDTGEDISSCSRGTRILIWVDARQPHQALAAASFIDEVVAHSPRAPDIRVRVLARTPSLSGLNRSKAVSVEVVAFAGDLSAELAAADVVIVPDQIGSGLKNRLLDAMAAGRPVLASETAAEGFDFVDGRDLAVYRDLRDACAKLARMLDDEELRRRLGEGARAAVSAAYDPSVVSAALLHQHMSLKAV